MEKKYQIFLSSTYLDLKEERQAVSRSILNLGHVPAGMELFPASSVDQMTFIEKVIDVCDYYVLIIGGRYGSLSQDGLSYTEREYKYAIEKGLPVLSFLHGDTGELKSKNTDTDPEQIKRLEAFRERVSKNRLVKQWTNLPELESAVVISLTSVFRENPQVGWRRDNDQLPIEALTKLNELSKRSDWYANKYLEANRKVADYENLENTSIDIRYVSSEGHGTFTITGEEVISEFAADLRRGISPENLNRRVYELVGHSLPYEVDLHEVSAGSIEKVLLFLEVFEIAEVLPDGFIRIRNDKKHFLKAAFRPLKKVLQDEVPF
jgi:hypothetical protein